MIRKIIFKCHTGSHLYGTNHANSDMDFVGVFLPSIGDLLSMDRCPTEWTENSKISEGTRNTKDDIDCKYLSLQRFCKLAGEGQPTQLEMLFAPTSKTLICTEEWQEIQANRDIFLSSKGILPFIGFAVAQMHKSSLKGENLNIIRKLINWSSVFTPQELNGSLSFLLRFGPEEGIMFAGDTPLNVFLNDWGATVIEVAGRQFDINIRTKNFVNSLKTLEEKYGTRSNYAAQYSFDYKSLGHALRLIGEAEEFVLTGKITFPRPDAEYLKSVLLRRDTNDKTNWRGILEEKIGQLKAVAPQSPLPDKPNWSKINQLCIDMLKKHIT